MSRVYNYWNEKEIDYLKNNFLKLDIEELEYNLDRTKSSIQNKAGKLNLTKNHFPWTEKEVLYLKNSYLNGYPDLLNSNLKNHSWDSIKIKANLLGLRIKDKLVINEDFFKVWNPEMAYVFGFWIADGNMGRNNYRISFDSKDYYLLNTIKSILNSDHKIPKNRNAFQLLICNKIMYNDLLKLGGIPAKSLIIQFPEVPAEYLSHFIRGYFDGDGSFYIYKMKKYKYLGSNFCGNIDFLTILKYHLKENINIDPTGFCIANKNYNPRIYLLEYFGKKAIALGDYIYQNSENLRLERKFEIYDQMKNRYLKKLSKKSK